MEWISVDERMPEDGVWVLAYVYNSDIETAAWNERCGLFENGFEWLEEVTHWMPLPSPPEVTK